MATLVLTVAGGAVGGPIGAMLGASIGGAIDRGVLFRPRRREGPRLAELSVQTSSYGSPICQLFGTMRVAGSVIWSTDLIEHRASEGGGKAGPGSVAYTYSASFAVLLSARPILGVGRIWADGKLLRGAGGDWKVPVTFRLHLGSEDQDADPLIASAEGVDAAPAHRGCAYAVFENLPLAEFANRIPSLTFEVEADPAAVTCGAIVQAISNGLIAGDEATTELGGFAAYGDALRGVVEGLADASGTWIAADGTGLSLTGGAGAVETVADAGAGAGRPGRRGVRAISPVDTAPMSLSVAYHDPARDYQAGLQRAARPGAGRRHVQLDLAAALDAGAAKTLATAALSRAEIARERRTLALDWRHLAISPGARVTIAGEPGRWRITGWSFEAMILSLELTRVARAALAVAAQPGRVTPAPDLVAGPTLLHAFEIPALDDAVLSAPRLTIAAAGAGPGWRRAALSLSLDRGARWTAIGSSAAPATIGIVAVAAGAGPSTIADWNNSVEVELAAPFISLAGATDAALAAGVNMALVGDEMLQFALAEQIGATRWRLSGLWRGRRGTEAAIGAGTAGDRFVLLDSASLIHVDLPADSLGGTARVMAIGLADGGEPPTADVVISGASVLPPSPVHVRAAVVPHGDIAVSWVRRSRAGWRWIDGVDAPIAEEAESHAILVEGDEGPLLAREVAECAAIIPAEFRTHAGARVSVRQRGLFGLGAPTQLPLPPL